MTGAKAENHDNERVNKIFLAKIGDHPGVLNCFKQLDHLCLPTGSLDLLFCSLGEGSYLER